MKSIAERKAQLETRLAELKARLHDIEEQLDEPATRDDDDRAAEREGDEVLEGIGQVGLNEIRALEQALHRVEVGEYGFCAKCGDRISEDRLDVVPYAPLCQRCASSS